MQTETEKWIPIKGYEGLYEVSNQGRVRSYSRPIRCRGGKTRVIKEKILKTFLNPYGYPMVNLYRIAREQDQCRVHRLVAQHFIPNPRNAPEVNHIDFNRTNASVDNLEWVFPIENIRHSRRFGRYLPGTNNPKGYNQYRRVP